ncbi:hypothetical protein D3C84_782430 [compost metagenome]
MDTFGVMRGNCNVAEHAKTVGAVSYRMMSWWTQKRIRIFHLPAYHVINRFKKCAYRKCCDLKAISSSWRTRTRHPARTCRKCLESLQILGRMEIAELFIGCLPCPYRHHPLSEATAVKKVFNTSLGFRILNGSIRLYPAARWRQTTGKTGVVPHKPFVPSEPCSRQNLFIFIHGHSPIFYYFLVNKRKERLNRYTAAHRAWAFVF